ncbi:MAG TPA: aldose 1-epimerase, partial [Pirellulales bacterium]|nr:aldose 1-epimerase [Pirellulales bacterium]
MKRRATLLLSMLLLFPFAARAGESHIEDARDRATGWSVLSIKQGDTAIRLVPSAGANVFSISYKGTELLKSPKSLKDLPGFNFGVPVLYPMPNRVRDGVFTFGGREYKFPPNNNGNFLHGLVHSAGWERDGNEIIDGHISVKIPLKLRFEPGSDLYKLFPNAHTLSLAIEALDNGVRWTYTVDNSNGHKPVPFGFAIHPYFLYQGPRSETYITIPATNLIESEKLLPTGKLLDLTGSNWDARQPKSLEGFLSDDVYFGMQSNKPAVIDFRQARLKITLNASDDFTHLVL